MSCIQHPQSQLAMTPNRLSNKKQQAVHPVYTGHASEHGFPALHKPTQTTTTNRQEMQHTHLTTQVEGTINTQKDLIKQKMISGRKVKPRDPAHACPCRPTIQMLQVVSMLARAQQKLLHAFALPCLCCCWLDLRLPQTLALTIAQSDDPPPTHPSTHPQATTTTITQRVLSSTIN